jgi:putative transposase
MPAETIPLSEGGIVQFGDENWRIVLVDGFDRVLASRVADGRMDFLPVSELHPAKWELTTSGEARLSNPAEESVALTSQYVSSIKKRIVRTMPSEEHQTEEERQLSNTVVEEFQTAQKVFSAPRKVRRQLIAEMCKKFGYSNATAYRRLKILQLHGTADALRRAIRDDCGVPKLRKQVINLVDDYLKDFRFVETPKPLAAVTDLINGKCRELGYAEISLSAVRNIEQQTSLKNRLEMRGRKNQVRDQFRPKVGHLPGNDYPLAIVQVDHTPCQICFVDEVDRQPIGDAWLTIVIDTYSRMILGYYLSFDAPSTLSTGMALAHAFLPKEQFLRDLGVSGEWPCWGFPDIVHVDNAAELNGRMMHGARRQYRFDIRNRPVGSPNFGGHVESAFRTFMFEIKSVPGTKFSNPTERAEYDFEGRAVMTLGEFDKYFADFIVNDYHLDEHSGNGMDRMAPIQRWKKGTLEGDIMPPTGLPDRPTDLHAVKLSLMPFEMRTVRNGTIEILGEHYHSGALTLIGDQIDLTKPLADRKFEIRYDPRNVSRVWLYNEATTSYIEAAFADIRKPPISKWENDARKKRLGHPADAFKDERYQSKIRRVEMLEQSSKKTKLQRRETEKAARRKRTALVQPPPPPMPAVTTPTKKQGLDPTRLAKLRSKVREAPIPEELLNAKADDET